MFNLLKRYTHWLHGQWPAGHVEKLPELNDDSSTNVPGVYVVGDLKGIPLLKFSIDSGAKTVRAIAADKTFQSLKATNGAAVDIAVIGAGTSGMAAALEAKKLGLSYVVIEGSEPFSTIVNFPKGKPIYTYPKAMTPEGDIHLTATVKEPLVEELKHQTEGKIQIQKAFAERIQRAGNHLEVILKDQPSIKAKRVIVAIGRSGNFRKLNVPGEGLDKVYNRLHDPKDFSGKKCLVVGGGDSALETAIALTHAGAEVTLSYRKKEFSRAKPDNIDMVQTLTKNPAAPVSVDSPVSERVTTATGDFMGTPSHIGSLRLLMGSQVRSIEPEAVSLTTVEGDEHLPNEVVFTMIGRDAPLDFFRRSGIRITGDWTQRRILSMASFMLFALALYNWKSGGFLGNLFYQHNWFPVSLATTYADQIAQPHTLLGTLLISASSPSFWYTLAYSLIVVTFGLKRIRRRKTKYVTWQTLTLMSVQVLPLFLLPEIILPWLGHNNLIPASIADHLFPSVTYGHGREYWRSYGFILAWPLMVYNVFTDQPLSWWLWISGIQTLIIIPGLIYFYGKGAYCGWICSCGALAETLGDNQRTKMPHGPKWNRLNMAGQIILAVAIL